MSLEHDLARSTEYQEVGEVVQRLVRAAWESEKNLEAAIEGIDDDEESASRWAVDDAAKSNPSGTWLSTIAVEGFRGVGNRAELMMNPAPGLTLVVGRNGSGKSSFAEGLEALLTGANQRWNDRPPQWKEGWRNLHHDGPVEVEAQFIREGDPVETVVKRCWTDDFDQSTVTSRVGHHELGFNLLGWSDGLINYKPFLSYNELGSMLEQKPAAIHDSMASVLGLDRLTEARERLRRARLSAQEPTKEARTLTGLLAAELGEVTDPRARQAIELITARNPDLDEVRRLAWLAGPGVVGDELATWRSLAPVDQDRCQAAARTLRAGLDRREQLGRADAGRFKLLADLLAGAVRYADEAGATPTCPVCQQGLLDDRWRQQTSAEIVRLQREAQSMNEAEGELVRAQQAAIAALGGPPAGLSDLDSELAQQWSSWSAQPDRGWSSEALIDRLGRVDELNAVVVERRRVALANLEQTDDDWRPHGEKLQAWLGVMAEAEKAKSLVSTLTRAEQFYKDSEARLRAERFDPIAERAGELWRTLGANSNVSLERVALEGTTTRRRVVLDVTVDGSDTSALGVMSQGELHALALALFLPRVTTSESPFRFVLIDDPVQAMDVARVDGLARVLAQVAETRQVIVFTHDDRLPAACRRLGVKADVIKVQRQARSRVSVTVGTSPAADALEDARVLVRTQQIPEDLKRRVVPLQCRKALEAQLRDRVWAALLSRGLDYDEVEQRIEEAGSAVELFSLALFAEQRPRNEVYVRMDDKWPKSASQLKYLNSAVHDPKPDMDVDALVSTTRRLVQAIGEG